MMQTTDILDITDRIGQLGKPVNPKPEWPMYSFERPAYMLWNSIANGLQQHGWTEDQIQDWLQSKLARWHLDGTLGEAIEALGKQYADTIVRQDDLSWMEERR